MVKISLSIFLCVWFSGLPAIAATINAASPSRADVNTAVTASSDGDTVTIPAGTATWTSGITLAKAITLQGAGVGQTIIRDGIASDYIINCSLVANLNTRITGIEFNDNGSGSPAGAPRFRMSGTSIDNRRLRVDNCKFDGLVGPAFVFYTVLGVVDHNTFIGKASGVAVWVGEIVNTSWGYTQDTTAFGDGAWVEADNFGTDKFLFFENNFMTNRYSTGLAMIDGHSGARYVVRSNIIHNGSLDMHANEANRTRGGRAYEFYWNTFTGNDTKSTAIYMRGGVGVVYSNTISGWTAGANLALLNFRSTSAINEPFHGSDGRNPWDVNHAANPQSSHTATGAGTLTVTVAGAGWTNNFWSGFTIRKTSGIAVSSMTRSGTTVTVDTTSAHGFITGYKVSIYGADQYGYNGLFQVTVSDSDTFTLTLADSFTPATPATGTIKCTRYTSFAEINSNTSDTITFEGSVTAGVDLSLAASDTFEINKVTLSMDQCGAGVGGDLGGVLYPSLPVGWNNQAISPWYEWGNTREAGADVDFSNTRSGGTYAVIVEGTHYINDTVKPGYTAYTYPHPLVTASGYGIRAEASGRPEISGRAEVR